MFFDGEIEVDSNSDWIEFWHIIKKKKTYIVQRCPIVFNHATDSAKKELFKALRVKQRCK